MKKFIFLSAFILFSVEVWAINQPASIIHYNQLGGTVLIVDKSACSVNVYQYKQHWENVRQFHCDVGQVAGEKFREGDLKTPTGFYWLSNAWTEKTLLRKYGSLAKIYGVGAFELNYPNYLDKLLYRKTGYGIWLHGTDKVQPEATKGCIATTNSDLMELAKFIELRKTPLIVEEKMLMASEEEVKKTKEALINLVEKWRAAWQSNDNTTYLSLYSKKFKTHRFNHRNWSAYKRIVNQRNKNRKILVHDLSVFKVNDVFNVQFVQTYSSSRINSIRKKFLYIIEEQGTYKILSERVERLSQPKKSPWHMAYLK